MSVAEYKTILKTPTGETIAELPDATNQTHSWYLNASGAANFSLPKHTKTIRPDDISLSYTIMETYRNGALLWSGQIDTRSGARPDSIMTYGAKDWFNYLKYVSVLLVPRSYTAQDPTAIISDLISYYNGLVVSSGLLMQMGVQETTQNRDRNYLTMDLKKAIYELTAFSTLGGVDVEIAPDRTVNVFQQKGTRLDSVSFELGRNMTDYWITEDSTEIATIVMMLGAGDGTDALYSFTIGATAATYNYKYAILSRKDILRQDTLDETAQREVQHRSTPKKLVTIHVDVSQDPGWGAYSVGDTVRIKIDDGLNQVDDWFRIYGIELTRTALGRETAKIITTPN